MIIHCIDIFTVTTSHLLMFLHSFVDTLLVWLHTVCCTFCCWFLCHRKPPYKVLCTHHNDWSHLCVMTTLNIAIMWAIRTTANARNIYGSSDKVCGLPSTSVRVSCGYILSCSCQIIRMVWCCIKKSKKSESCANKS